MKILNFLFAMIVLCVVVSQAQAYPHHYQPVPPFTPYHPHQPHYPHYPHYPAPYPPAPAYPPPYPTYPAPAYGAFFCGTPIGSCPIAPGPVGYPCYCNTFNGPVNGNVFIAR